MKKDTYLLLENYMLSCMRDSAHDKEHVYRVLYNAMEIAKHEECVDYDVLICACLLHDIGRNEQSENPKLCHAEVGAEKTLKFLADNHFDKEFAEKVAHCILCHRYRNHNIPQTLEAKILFDADKLDVTGAIGIARTLIYKGQVLEPLYTLDEEGNVSNGENDTIPSFFQEYKNKLETLYDKFYTDFAAKMAKQRRKAAVTFYENLLSEVGAAYDRGRNEVRKHVETITLIKPSMEFGEDIMQFRKELLEAGDCDSFAGCGSLRQCQSAEEWIDMLARWENKDTCPAGAVTSNTYIAVRDADRRIVGMIDLRHHIDHPILSVWGGHMGYTVRPSERGKGYAREMLRQNLQKCRERNMDRILITCSRNNPASEKTILANGGVFEKEVLVDGEYIKRYWITL